METLRHVKGFPDERHVWENETADQVDHEFLPLWIVYAVCCLLFLLPFLSPLCSRDDALKNVRYPLVDIKL